MPVIITRTKKGDDELKMDQMLGRTGSKSSNKKKRMQKQANKIMKEITGEGSKNISKIDRARVDELTDMLTRNDGGMAMKTRVF